MTTTLIATSPKMCDAYGMRLRALADTPTYLPSANVETVLSRVRRDAPEVHVLVVDDKSVFNDRPRGTRRRRC